jgi:hypothetical protein
LHRSTSPIRSLLRWCTRPHPRAPPPACAPCCSVHERTVAHPTPPRRWSQGRAPTRLLMRRVCCGAAEACSQSARPRARRGRACHPHAAAPCTWRWALLGVRAAAAFLRPPTPGAGLAWRWRPTAGARMGRCTAGAVVAATPGAARARRAATAVQPPTAGEGAGEAGGATYEETIRARSARKQVGEAWEERLPSHMPSSCGRGLGRGDAGVSTRDEI